MRIVIIGGSGHVGTYLTPYLAESGHEVVNISRGGRQPYQPHPAWTRVEQITADREREEETGSFGQLILDQKPDAVIDMICFTPRSARMLVEALRGKVQHFLHCGTIWVHGHSTSTPTTEDQTRRPFGTYGIQKAEIESLLLREARLHGFPATVLHPGHIVGPGWIPLNPAGNFNPDVFSRLARGESLILPNLGMETVHHVHAGDVAQAFALALTRRSVVLGESFHVTSPAALTLRGYAEAVSEWFGQKPDLRFMPWEELRSRLSQEDASATWDHIAHSPCCSISKAGRLLGYHPKYTSLEAVRESLNYLVARGTVAVS